MCSTLTELWWISLLLFLPLPALAQLHQSERLEIPIQRNEEAYGVIPVKEQGVILFRRLVIGKTEQLELLHTDTIFQQKWRGFLPVEKNFKLVNQTSLGNNLYLLFYIPEISDRSFKLYQIDLQTGNYVGYTVRNTIPFFPATFKATPTGVLIGGYFIRVPIVLFFNLTLQRSKILPGLFNEAGELAQLHVNADASFDLLISSRNFQKQKTLWIKNYSPEGDLIRNVILEPGQNYHLLFGSTVKTANNTQLIAGVYGTRNADYSQGIFVTQVYPDNEQETRYYSFADLENFFQYLRAKREKRMKERIARKKIKGKKIRLQYRFIVHEFIQHHDQFILLGEAFYPKYRSIDRGLGYSPGGTHSLVFDGYQYTHAVVLGIANEGQLLWDNSFEINDIKTFTLEQFVKMDARDDKIALLYLFDNKIQTKIIQNNTVVEGKTYNPLLREFNDAHNIDDEININYLDYWYGDYFLAYGIQSLVAPTRTFKNRKKVFFINKINYQ
jgi:hypothetical protein